VPRAKLRTPELRDRLLRSAIETLVSDGVAGFTTRRTSRYPPNPTAAHGSTTARPITIHVRL